MAATKLSSTRSASAGMRRILAEARSKLELRSQCASPSPGPIDLRQAVMLAVRSSPLGHYTTLALTMAFQAGNAIVGRAMVDSIPLLTLEIGRGSRNAKLRRTAF